MLWLMILSILASAVLLIIMVVEFLLNRKNGEIGGGDNSPV
jgi:hypothetical protein